MDTMFCHRSADTQAMYLFVLENLVCFIATCSTLLMCCDTSLTQQPLCNKTVYGFPWEVYRKFSWWKFLWKHVKHMLVNVHFLFYSNMSIWCNMLKIIFEIAKSHSQIIYCTISDHSLNIYQCNQLTSSFVTAIGLQYIM